MRETAYLSLGSNLGDRVESLRSALRRLEADHTRLLAVSSVYETLPQGKTDQPSFLNLAAAVETALVPKALLHHLQGVEAALGRQRRERWGPRTIDIDLLLYGQRVLAEPDLILPHPRMCERAFVLVPLLELNPDLVLPSDRTPLRTALLALPDQGVVRAMGPETFLGQTSGVQ